MLLYWGFPAFLWIHETSGCPYPPAAASPFPGLGLRIPGCSSGHAGFASPAGIPVSASTQTIAANFFYQMGFLAFLSVFINLNPLLELDGYFILMDWLDMPGLRPRAFHFIQHELWGKLKPHLTARRFWTSLSRRAHLHPVWSGSPGLLHLRPAVCPAWHSADPPPGAGDQPLARLWPGCADPIVLGIAMRPSSRLVLPVSASLEPDSAWVEWLSHQELLGRVEILALLLVGPLLLISAAAFPGMPRLSCGSSPGWCTWAPSSPWSRWPPMAGSRFNGLCGRWRGMACLTLAQLAPETPCGGGCGWSSRPRVLASGLIAWFTVRPAQWQTGDRVGWIIVLLLSLATGLLLPRLSPQATTLAWVFSAFIQMVTTISLMALVALLINFRPSRLVALDVLRRGATQLPWLYHFPCSI
ncbi:MAG: site-2 protease family protein [Chloroflexi bacterium]|nr:site-2 protease family protein [Chloroflexota bacterium]